MNAFERLLRNWVPDWRRSAVSLGTATPRQLRQHQLRVAMVKNFWILAGLLMLALPILAFAVALSLFTTFVSFMYLDEADLILHD